ncbi:TPA: hypothetical protein DCX16_00800 [bacterium]|nr:hypothetical protein [bacterium]
MGKEDREALPPFFISMKRAFTLIELMIVVAVIGMLLAMLIPRVSLLIDRAREKTTAKNLKTIYSAIITYSDRDYGRIIWPEDASSLRDILTSEVDNIKMLDRIPYALLRRGCTNNHMYENSNDIYNASDYDFSVIDISVRNHGGWVYISSGRLKGEVFINASNIDTFGIPYSSYPCW